MIDEICVLLTCALRAQDNKLNVVIYPENCAFIILKVSKLIFSM